MLAATGRGWILIDLDAFADEVPSEESLFAEDLPVTEANARAFRGNGRRPTAGRVAHPRAVRRTGAVTVVLGLIAVALIAMIAVVIYLYNSSP